MQRHAHRRVRLHRSMMCLLLVASVSAPLAATSAHGSSAASVRNLPVPPTPSPTPPPGTDLFRRDTDIARYIQGENGQMRVQLYNSTVGAPDASGWHLRDTTLIAANTPDTVMPARIPFGLKIAQNLSASSAATLTAEDGVTLGVGLASVNGTGPAAAVAGQVSGATITYANILAPVPESTGMAATTAIASGSPTATGTNTAPVTPTSAVVMTPAGTVPVTLTAMPVTSTSTVPLTPTSTMPATPTSTAVTTPPNSVPMTSTPTTSTASAVDFALRSTVSGLDVRLTLHDATTQGPIALAFTLDPRLFAVQQASNAIEVMRTITDYDHYGRPHNITGPDFILEAPVVGDSSTDAAAPALTGPVTMSLVPGSGDRRAVVLTVDPSWLQDSRRVFPVTVDLPIETGFSASDTGLFGTVNSCAPTVPAPLTQVVVGTEGGCVLHGQAYFDVKSLPPSTSVISATLNMYTPNHSGPTGITLYPNAPISEPPLGLHFIRDPHQIVLPPAVMKFLGPHAQLPQWRLAPDSTIPAGWLPPKLRQPTSWLPPSWNSAPQVMTGSVGIAQSSSNVGWQSWDVTTLVRQWVQDRSTNNGLTLEGNGMPVTFASALGRGDSDAAFAPYLDIVYAPTPSPALSDGATIPFGISETYFGPDDASGCSTQIVCNSYCLNAQRQAALCGNTSISYTLTNFANIGGSVGYIRFGVDLTCSTYWPTMQYYTPYVEELENAYKYKLVPIVDFLYPPTTGANSCPDDPNRWFDNIIFFMIAMYDGQLGSIGKYPIPKPIPYTYYEIGNEANYSPAYSGTGGWANYATDFAKAATAVYDFYHTSTNTNYMILPSGVLNPTADMGQYGYNCLDSGSNTSNWFTFEVVPFWAATGFPNNLPSTIFGEAAHPYHYTTSNATDWEEYYTYGNTYPGPGDCGDLQHMIQLWQQPNMPLIFTEDNWDTAPDVNPPDGNTCTPESDYDSCEVTYIADLFSWLTDNSFNSSNSNVRVLIFRGNDTSQFKLGLFGAQGNLVQGFFPPNQCPGFSSIDGNFENLSTIYAIFTYPEITCH